MKDRPGNEDLHIAPVPENLPAVQRFLDTALREAGFSERQRQLGAVAAEEVFINICSYAGAGDVTVSLHHQGHAVQIAFADTGAPFNPLMQEGPDLTLSAGERPVGGLGIHMIRTIADDVSYRRQDGTNILELTLTRKDELL